MQATKAESARNAWTPPQLAKQLGIDGDKVLRWIKSGELPAINAATSPNGRPRYLILREGLEAFKAKRACVPDAKPARRRNKAADYHEYV